MMNAIPGVCMVMPESGFLSWIDISKLGTSTFICDYLLQHAHVMVNSGVPYGQGGEGIFVWYMVVIKMMKNSMQF